MQSPAPHPRTEPDALARLTLLGIAAGRIGIGIGASGATRRALDQLGFKRPGPEAIALARLAGVRDIALGLLTFAAATNRSRLREVGAVGALVDAGDAAAFIAPLAARDGIDAAALKSAPLGIAAALAGIWAIRRL